MNTSKIYNKKMKRKRDEINSALMCSARIINKIMTSFGSFVGVKIYIIFFFISVKELNTVLFFAIS